MNILALGFSAIFPLSAAIAVYVLCVVSSYALTRARLRRLRELSTTHAAGVVRSRLILLNADRYALALQLVKFLGALVAGAVAMASALELLRTYSPTSFLPWLSGLIGLSVVAVILAGVTFLMVQLAKSWAQTNPETTLCALSYTILVIGRLTRPLVVALEYVVDRACASFGLTPPVEREAAKSAEEISEMVERGAEAGEIEADEREMIEAVFRIPDTVVREVMTPRADIVHISDTATLMELKELFLREGVSRVLVTGESLDVVRGILNSKDLIPAVGVSEMGTMNWQHLIRSVPIIPNSKKIDELLEEFRREATHFAVVLDEHAGVDGVITIEDLLEEIVGEIFDEYDTPATEVAVRRTKGGDLVVRGSLGLDDFESASGLSLPRGDYDTIAGFVIQALGRLPVVGEIIEHGDVRIRVEEASAQRVTRLRILGARPRALRRVGIEARKQHEPVEFSRELAARRSINTALEAAPRKIGISGR